MNLVDRAKRGWNAFMNKDPTPFYVGASGSYTSRPDRVRFSKGNEKTIVTSLYNKIAVDVASLDFRHVVLDADDRFVEYKDSGLDRCLTLEANIDQTGRAFIQDLVASMLDEGCVAAVPIDTDIDPMDTSSFSIETMRTGKIIDWRPRHVVINVYNDRTGHRQDIIMPKDKVAILENPFYAIMNEPNSTMQRLIRKLALSDRIDDKIGSNKLDLLIKLPYAVKGELKRQQADQRLNDIEKQLSESPLGIAYIDGTENVTQLNRPVENSLTKEIEFLTSMLFSQLGFHQSVLDGTADEQTMLNYTHSIIETIAVVIVTEFRRKFLSKTARSQRQSVTFFRDPFKLVPINNIADIADKFTRNEIMTSNEIRQKVGMKPSDDPKADKLINSNISQPADQQAPTNTPDENLKEGGEIQNGS